MNECMPKYEPGQDLTGHVSQGGGVTGKRLAGIVADKQGVEAVSDDTTGGNIVVGYPAAGGRVVGVFGHDAADTRKVKLVRGSGKVVPITAGAALAYDQEVEAGVTGKVVPLGTTPGGVAIGRTFRAAAINTDALVELYVGGSAGAGAQAAVPTLTNNVAGAAADDTVEVISDPADTPASADALRDDLVANVLPDIRNNFAELTVKVNAILARLRSAGIIVP